jgi:DNA-binding transcriptional regulator YiaG
MSRDFLMGGCSTPSYRSNSYCVTEVDICFYDRPRKILDQARAVALKSPKLTPAYLTVLRQALGLTQQQFGRAVGVDKMTVYRWEQGTRKPGAKSARRIARLRAQRVGSSLVLS